MDNDLMALVVHDLKNPLAALLSNIGFVGSCVRGDRVASEAVHDCQLSLEVLVRLVENLGAIGSLETGRGRGGDVDVAVGEAITSVEARMRRHAAAAGMRVVASCAPGVGRIAVSAKLLELALDNLVATSLAYAPPGSTVRVEARRADDHTVVIAVVDDGEPVPEEARPLLLRRDGQAALKAAGGGRYGRGLGLYLAAIVARAAGGELSAGEVGGSSVFEIRVAAPPVTGP
jgi:signal transduction histidine kinase